MNLAEIFAAGGTLPAPFLALRREALRVAADRAFRGSSEPMPEVPTWPGVFIPMACSLGAVQARTAAREKEAQLERSRKWKRENPRPVQDGPRKVRMRPTHHFNPCRSEAVGSIKPGARVQHNGAIGAVVAFLPAWADPMAFIPHAFPTTRIMGSTTPSVTPRYIVRVNVGIGPRLFFPRAAALERDNPHAI